MWYLHAFFRDLSIKYKIALIVLVTSGTALMIAGASLVTFDVRSYKTALVSDLSVKADIIAANSTAALAFEDYDSAKQTLNGLVHEYRILVAYLLSAEGLTFASYSRADVHEQHRKPVLREEGFFFADDFLAVRRPIYFDGEVLGHIYIEADLGGVSERVQNFVATVMAISAATLFVIMILTSRLQRFISTPLLSLADLAKQISRDRDYSVRAQKVSDDEVGTLIDGFNEMLVQIEERDAKLERHRDELQTEVGKQTAELRLVNRRLKESEQRIRAIVEGTASSTGQEFFDALVKTLARALETRWVMVTMLRHGSRLEALALWNGEAVERNVYFPVADSPCEMVMRYGAYKFEDGVSEAFDSQPVLEAWGVQSYTGVALNDSAGQVIGVLCAMHDRPLPDPAKDTALLRVYGSRAAAELERLRVEADLQRSESSTRAILDSAADGIITISSRGTVETLNAAAEQIFACHGLSIVGASIDELMRFEEDATAQERLVRDPGEALSSLVGKRIALQGIRGSGEAFPMNLAVSEVRIGEQAAYTAIVRDITREHELDRMKSDFVSTVSHEIRTPLVAIINSAKILLKKGADNPTVNAKFSSIIVDEGMRLNRLINDLLDLSKLDAGKVEWNITDAAPADLVSRVVDVAKARSEGSGVTIHCEATGVLPSVRADVDRVVQVLTNLLDNAIKFTPVGGRVDVEVSAMDGGFVRFDVRDTGIGIAPEHQAVVFDRFKQIGNVMTDKPKGTGLGLAISKEIIEYLGGRIGVESVVGNGADFWFTLPVSTRTADGVAGEGDRSFSNDPLAPTVLVVDDDESAREYISYILRRERLNVVHAHGGEAALEQIRKQRPALITLDVMMPKMSGYEVLEALRDDPMLSDVPVVVMSVLGDRDSRDRAMQRGASAYLVKPVDVNLLVASVRRLLNEQGREVLVIEDDVESATAIKSQLAAQGFSVVQTAHGRHGLDFAGRLQPELIVLGAGTSTAKARDLLVALRDDERTESIPVVVLTSIDEAQGAEYFDAGGSTEPAVRGDLEQLLRLIAERQAAASRLAELARVQAAVATTVQRPS
jgi:PAS domain S-box-containing protein